METVEKVLGLKRDLINKREMLEKNCLSLKMFKPKDMPLAIYDYVIEELGGIVGETKQTKSKQI
jgi:hypothetical protein